MDGTELAAIIGAITAVVSSAIVGMRRLLREVYRLGREAGRASLIQEQSAETIAAKNREIHELQRLLEQQTAHPRAVRRKYRE